MTSLSLSTLWQRFWLLLGLILVGGLLFSAGLAKAQNQKRAVQEIISQVDEASGAFYELPDLKKGQTLYLRAEGISGDLDPFLIMADDSLNRAKLSEQYQADLQKAVNNGEDPLTVGPKIADKYFLAWNDDYGNGHNAAIEYTIPADGNYKVAVISTVARPTFGKFKLLVGLNAPDVLDGLATDTGDTLAIIDEENTVIGWGTDVITGTLTLTDTDTRVLLNDVEAGDTLYAYVEVISGTLKPTLYLRDYSNKDLAIGNFSGQETTATAERTFPTDSSGQSITIEAANNTEGVFRLVVGRNAPEALSGEPDIAGQSVIKEPIEVDVGIKLQQITDVDQKAENFSVVATIQLQWQDPALAFNPDDCNCAFQTYRGDGFSQFANNNNIIWPEFTFFNQQGNRWTQNRLVVVWADGRALYLERFSTTFQAPDFNFRLFPFDTQDFYIRVDSIFPNEFFAFNNFESFTALGDQLGEEEWYIVDWDTEVSAQTDNTQFSSPRYSFHFQSRRHLSFYIFRLFVPIIIIIIVSWSTFFLKDYGKRVDVASGNLLLFIAFNFTIGDTLPRLGYLTFMDVILVSTFIVTSLVIVFSVYLKRMEIVGKQNFANTVDKYMIWVYPLAYITAFVIVSYFFS